MNAGLECLSLPELLDARHGMADRGAVAHLAACRRCRAMLSTIPDGLELPKLTVPMPIGSAGQRSATRTAPPTVSTDPGAVWRALGEPDDDFAFVVAILDVTPGAPDRIAVAPVFGSPAVPTDRDLLLDTGLLGYPAFVELASAGTILRDQLIEPIGELPPPLRGLLTALHRAVLGDGPAPPPAAVGVPVIGDEDPRLLAAEERRQALQRLWRAAARPLAAGDGETTTPFASERDGALAALIDSNLNGIDAEWDRPTLLELSSADGGSLDRFLADRLDLTDRTDVGDLARVLHTLGIPWETTEPAVSRTLERSPGGVRAASRAVDLPIAARGAPGASEAAIVAALRAGYSSVDQSEAARGQQIADYVTELRKALDDLE